MKQLYKPFLHAIGVLCMLIATQASAQLNVNTAVTANDLANSIVGGGVTISNVNLNCGANAAGIFSNGNTTNLGITDGVLLTTGLASDVPNSADVQASINNGNGGDADLAPLVGQPLNDACILEFDFEPNDNIITVQYVFGSEEYPEWVCSEFNDVFAFFVNGPNPGGGSYTNENVALIPGTALPVTINNINNNGADCAPFFPEFYIDNETGTTIVYDGFTVVLTAEVAVTPGEIYSFKFAIADASDAVWDSGVFIKGSSFSTFLCQAGQIGFNENLLSQTEFCSYEQDKSVQLFNNVISPSDFYSYILTDATGEILEIDDAGSFDLAGYATGDYHFYGLSYSGIISGLEVGNNISDIDAASDEGCYELSNPATASIIECVDIECAVDVTISCDESLDPLNTGETIITGDPNDIFSLDYSDEAIGSCPTVIVRTWTLVSPPGVAPIDLSCTQTITVTDELAPAIDGEEELTVECDAVEEPTFTVEDNCDENPDIDVVDVVEPGPCTGYYTITRTITATDNCDNESTLVQTINVVDTTAPEFNEDILETLSVQCPDDVPPMEECTATDNCSDDVLIWSFETSLEAGDTTCVLTDAIGPGVDWSVVLFNLPGATDYYVFSEPGTMQMFNDGSAIITGTVEAIDNPAQQWDVFIRLENKRNWTDWSDLGRDYKDDLLLAGDNFEDWSYYEMDNTSSFLIGAGDFAGSFLQLSHMPANFLYGFQCGLAANNKNANFGLSGWFHYDGFFNGNAVNGHGDVNVDKECEGNQTESECEYDIERFWIAVDDCGNTNITNQTISVKDTTPPEFTEYPDDLFVACIDDVPAADTTLFAAVDNCDGEVGVEFLFEFMTGNDCEAIITRSYIASDKCGNDTTFVHTITVADTLAPVLEGVPADTEVSCDDVPEVADVTATDNCYGEVDVIYSYDSIPGNCPNNYTLVRIWTAVDSCENEASATQTILVSDTEAPEITACPADTTYDCLNDVPAANTDLVSAFDNCGEVSVEHIGDSLVGDECEGMIIRTYRVYDECFNFSDCVQTIWYNDDEAPVFDNPPAPAISVDCDNIPNPADVTATDNCDDDVLVEYTEILFSGGCPGVLQRTWVATDDCGNSATIEQFITLIDTVAPVLHNLPFDAVLECSESLPDTADVWATDNCNASVDVDFSQSIEQGNCPQEYTIYRTWTATDSCDNAVSHTQVIQVVDTEAPVFNVENTVDTLDCSISPEIITPEAYDECLGMVPVDEDITTIPGDCPNEWTEIYTWTAEDSCGNSASVTKTIHFVDETAPVFTSVPEDLYFECIDSVPAPDTSLLTAEDLCGPANITFEGDEQEGDDCDAVIYRTYHASDSCGNVAVYEQLIVVQDTTPPVFEIDPEDLVVSCDSVPAPVDCYAIDNCSNIVAAFFEEIEEGCPTIITRTWTATDICGNMSSVSRTITVYDNAGPTITQCPADAEYNCFDDIPEADTSLVSAVDNCGELSITHHSDVVEGDECSGMVIRTYRVYDECENYTDCVQVLEYNDDEAPVFINPPTDTEASCDNIPDAEDVEATDNCGFVDISYNETLFSGGCAGVLQRIWIATDLCGNADTLEQFITLIDTIAPTLHNVPEDETLLCSDAELEDLLNEINGNNIFGGGGGNNLTYYPGDGIFGTDLPLGVEDDAAPGFPAGSFAANGETKTAVNFTPQQLFGYDILVSDIASMSYYTKKTISSQDSPFPYLNWYLSMYTVADQNDDDAFWYGRQLNLEPYFSNNLDAPANEWTQWSTDAGSNQLRVFDPNRGLLQLVYGTYFDPFWDDLLAGPIDWSSYSAAYEGGEYDYTDETVLSFNIATGTAWAHIFEGQVDGVRIELFNGDVATINFEPEDNGGEDDGVTATDNCSDSLDVEFSQVIIPGECPQQFTIERTWTATDECENTTTETQTITVVAVAPEISGEDMTFTVDCHTTPEIPEFTVTDACQEDVELVLDVDSIAGNCPNEWTEVYTWSATNACGLSAEERVVTITYVDDNGPEFTDLPEDLNLTCIADVPQPNINDVAAEDACGDVTVTHEGDNQVGDDCSAVIQRVYRATDACDNYVEYTQIIVVADTILPTFDGTVEPVIEAECDAVPAAEVLTASDNCLGAVVSYNEEEEAGECEGEYTIYRTWTATDSCGNYVTLNQTVHVSDNTPPVIFDVPEDATYTCNDSIPEMPELMADDNCSDVVTVSMEEHVEGYTGEDGLAECTLTTPLDVIGAAWAVWLPNNIGEPQYYYLTENSGQFVELSNGRAHLTGTVYAPANPNKQWIIDVYFKDRADWTTWSGLGRSYKDDAGFASDESLYENWDYYILNADSAVLTGDGLYTGSELMLAHAPASYYFGFQVGEAANNRNAADGMSGWFFYEGDWIGNEVAGIGDFAFESDCPECDYTITRIWTASDDCGNTTTEIQVITVQPGDGDELPEFGHDFSPLDEGVALSAWPNPATNRATIAFKIPKDAHQVQLEVLNMDGKVLTTLYRGDAFANQEYRFEFDGSSLGSGMYIYRLTTESATYVEKLMLLK